MAIEGNHDKATVHFEGQTWMDYLAEKGLLRHITARFTCEGAILDRWSPETRTGAWIEIDGVRFIGHPNLKRLLNHREFVGHPLRKDYHEAGGYHGVSNTRPDPLVRLGGKVDAELIGKAESSVWGRGDLLDKAAAAEVGAPW